MNHEKINKALMDMFSVSENKPFSFYATIRFKDDGEIHNYKFCFLPSRTVYLEILENEKYENFDESVFYYFVGYGELCEHCNNPQDFEFTIEDIDTTSFKIEHKLPSPKQRVVDLGTIELGSKVMVSDPCYTDLDAWYNKEINIKSGKYHCTALVKDCGVWGERVMELTIVHDDNKKAKPKSLYGASVAVDSGQCGFYDYHYFKENTDKEETERYEWYQRVCDITLDDKNDCCGAIDGVGVVASSGYGDGLYRIYCSRNSKKDIVGLKLNFDY